MWFTCTCSLLVVTLARSDGRSFVSQHRHAQPEKKFPSHISSLLSIRGGISPSSSANDIDYSDGGGHLDDSSYVELTGSPDDLKELDGLYVQTDWELNKHVHFERTLDSSASSADDSTSNASKAPNKIHLYWSGKQWVLHYDLDPSRNYENLIGYAQVRCDNPMKTSNAWYVRNGKSYKRCPTLTILRARRGAGSEHSDSASDASAAYLSMISRAKGKDELFGIPRTILPHFLAFMFDAIAVGLAMPLLPFYVMELGANALQLSLVVSANYVAQMFGCIIMGKVSDLYGRRVVLVSCLAASSLSLFCVSRANSLVSVAAARVISGSFGGLLPVMQSSVADSSEIDDRPKYIGRIMATFGLGFVLGPAISALLPNMKARSKIRLAAALPLTGLLIAVVFAKETKKDVRGVFIRSSVARKKAEALRPLKSKPLAAKVLQKEEAPLTLEVIFLVLNGFLIMYAFATETIYAMFLKDSFGFGESVLSALFAFNGTLMGIFQVFFIKPLIGLIGKHATLVLGDALLGAGMLGLALVRNPALHFTMFAVHILGYSIADTALVSLISRYSAPSSQGRDLALNQAAQSCARIFSPLCAGILYEYSKRPDGVLPVGALPFLAGGICPAVAILVPTLLYMRNISQKKVRAAQAAARAAAAVSGEGGIGNQQGSEHYEQHRSSSSSSNEAAEESKIGKRSKAQRKNR